MKKTVREKPCAFTLHNYSKYTLVQRNSFQITFTISVLTKTRAAGVARAGPALIHMGGEDPVLVGKGALTVGTLTKHVVITNNMGCYRYC